MTLLPGWTKYIELPIDHTKIDADLSNYPLAILLSAAAGIGDRDLNFIFTELGANSLKLAVGNDDGTEDYVEVVEWTAGTPFAELWSNIPAVSTAADTMVRLFYSASHADNSTYVGVTGSTPGKAVWDANFVGVWHMNDNPDNAHIADSTGVNNGTKEAVNAPLQTTGYIGKAEAFSSVRITNGAGNYYPNASYEMLLRMDDLTNDHHAMTFSYIGSWNTGYMTYHSVSGTRLATGVYTDLSTVYIADGTFGYAVYNVTAGAGQYYIAGTTAGTFTPLNISTNQLGRADSWATRLIGTLDETRISNIARPPAHIHANDHNWKDDLVTYSAEQVSGHAAMINALLKKPLHYNSRLQRIARFN